MFRLNAALLFWFLSSSIASAEIDGSRKLVIDFTKPEEAAKLATWSDPKNLDCTKDGFGWDGEKLTSRDGWLETEPLAIGSATSPPQNVTLSVKLQANYPMIETPAANSKLFNSPSIFVRHSSDRVNWTDWQATDMHEDPRAQGSVIYTANVGVPRRAILPYQEKMREWVRRPQTNWVIDEDEYCRWLVAQDPKYFEKNRPFVGYVQFLIDGSFRGGQRITKFEAEVPWWVSGIGQPPKDPQAVKAKGAEWCFRGVEAKKEAAKE